MNSTCLILSAGVCLLIFGGVILGVVALCGVSRHGRKGLFAPALVGTILNGLAVLVPVFMLITKVTTNIQKNSQNLANIKRQSDDLHWESQKELAHPGTNRALVGQQMEGLQKSMQDAAQNMSGDDALVMHASADYVESMTKLKKNLDAATAELTAAKLLVARNITNAGQLKERRKVVQGFLDANEQLKIFVQHGAERFSDGLSRWHVPDKKAAEVLRSYRVKADILNPLIVEVRNCDSRIGEAMLGIVDLEETNWGNWHVQTNTGKIIFDDGTLAESFNDYMAEIRTATADEKKVDAKFLASSKAKENDPQ